MDKGGAPLVWLESYAVGGLGQMIPDTSCSSGHAYCAGLAACPFVRAFARCDAEG